MYQKYRTREKEVSGISILGFNAICTTERRPLFNIQDEGDWVAAIEKKIATPILKS
jgi:hypothetical protein